MTPESDPVSFSRFLLASGTVIVLMLALAWGLKFLNERGLARLLPQPSKPRRLQLLETLPIDARRRLVIAQCDDRQYLLLLGTNTELVVDQNLKVNDADKSLSRSV